ncbi:MAG TPA: hypothetical protein VHD63_08785, partial [Ktedonobacteraceae bacterium]|nr:hypothetical protein [Ktedonobacteraceae bacterium]
AILDLYRSPEKRASFIANAAEDYIPYQWEKMAQRYRDLLFTLSRKRPQPAREPEEAASVTIKPTS